MHPSYEQPRLKEWTHARKSDYWDVDRRVDLERLPETLEFFGEFSQELALFLPFAYWLSSVGLLLSHKIKTYYGMRCFYRNIECREFVEKHTERISVPISRRAHFLPIKDEFAFRFCGRSAYHVFPDFRAEFSSQVSVVDTDARPLLVVHNKHNFDFSRGPVNHISLHTLDIIFRLLSARFRIVYIRHGMCGLPAGFSGDHNYPISFDDRSVLDKHPDVLCFDDEYTAYKSSGGEYDLNTFKNVLYSRCHFYISSQGGGAHHIAAFSGSLLMILHRAGSEPVWAYHNGYYGMVSNPSPLLAVCHDEAELIRGLAIFMDAEVSLNRVFVRAGGLRVLEQLSPCVRRPGLVPSRWVSPQRWTRCPAPTRDAASTS
jgi:hypothetical protein